jgi:uncharacterized glyoxalase superfamily protein PhnB
MTWKPAGYPAVAPYLLVDDAQQLMAFLEKVFDAGAGRMFEGPDGAVMHAEVRIGDSIVMLADATPEWRPAPGMIHVYVEDSDATYRRALAAGAAALQEPQTRAGESDRRGGFLDPAGNSWWVSTQVEADGA